MTMAHERRSIPEGVPVEEPHRPHEIASVDMVIVVVCRSRI